MSVCVCVCVWSRSRSWGGIHIGCVMELQGSLKGGQMGSDHRTECPAAACLWPQKVFRSNGPRWLCGFTSWCSLLSVWLKLPCGLPHNHLSSWGRFIKYPIARRKILPLAWTRAQKYLTENRTILHKLISLEDAPCPIFYIKYIHVVCLNQTQLKFWRASNPD